MPVHGATKTLCMHVTCGHDWLSAAVWLHKVSAHFTLACISAATWKAVLDSTVGTHAHQHPPWVTGADSWPCCRAQCTAQTDRYEHGELVLEGMLVLRGPAVEFSILPASRHAAGSAPGFTLNCKYICNKGTATYQLQHRTTSPATKDLSRYGGPALS